VRAPRKPQGQSGAIRFTSEGPAWRPTRFEQEKAARELQISEMFVRATERFIMRESEPKYRPFVNLTQNEEDDLDFTLDTAQGRKKLELAEFAPLRKYGPQFENAPRTILSGDKAKIAIVEIRRKSEHQGGRERMLLLYSTEHAFKLDPGAVELMRRALMADPPRFERIYYVSPHDETDGTAWEVYPGAAAPMFAGISDQQLGYGNQAFPHPADMVRAQAEIGPKSSRES
jgi:hypothetical protein